MGIKEMFSKKGADNAQTVPNQSAPAQATVADKRSELEGRASEIVAELLKLEEMGRLERTPEEYVHSEEFIALLAEFPTAAAVRIFDAENRAKSAKEEGRNGAIEDIRRRRELPRSMKSGTPAAPETDYTKMSQEAFSRLKRSLREGK